MLSGSLQRGQVDEEARYGGGVASRTRHDIERHRGNRSRSSRGNWQQARNEGRIGERVMPSRGGNKWGMKTHKSCLGDYRVEGGHVDRVGSIVRKGGGYVDNGSNIGNYFQHQTNQKPPMYRRSSQVVHSSSRRGYHTRRHEPYVKKRPAYTAPKPTISKASPSCYPPFETHSLGHCPRQPYVPSNPRILPIADDQHHIATDDLHEYANHPKIKHNHYQSPTSPPGYIPVSNAYQSIKPVARISHSKVNDATRAKLKRKLAVTILSEKLKQTLANEAKMCNSISPNEYDPANPLYFGNASDTGNQMRLEYDPAHPGYSS